MGDEQDQQANVGERCACGGSITGDGWSVGDHRPGCVRRLQGQDRSPLSDKRRPDIEGCICGLDERDRKARHSDECWSAAERRVQSGGGFQEDRAPCREPEFLRAPEARTGIPPWSGPCPSCKRDDVHHEDCPLRDGVNLGPCPECTHSSDGERKHWIGCSRIAPEQQAAYDARTPCPVCGALPGTCDPLKCGRFKAVDARGSQKAGRDMDRRLGGSTFEALGRLVDNAPPRPSWSTCPCGQASRPGGDTRTNVYRGDELVEVRYPHADGVQCCWTREKRR